jgi:hypothetical protein
LGQCQKVSGVWGKAPMQMFSSLAFGKLAHS